MAATPERQSECTELLAECTELLAAAESWVETQPDIRALGLAGSWARDEAQMSSDVDLVVLTEDVRNYVASSDCIPLATGQNGRIVRTQEGGPMTERRVELPSGFLIEFGFAPVSWARTNPVDPGTKEVVADGFRVLYEPGAVLSRLVDAVRWGRLITPSALRIRRSGIGLAIQLQ